MESDLHPMSYPLNLMFKFADDTTLLVPQNTDISAKAEIMNIKYWVFINKMEINWLKTIELIFRKPNLNLSLIPEPICDIKQVNEARLLGVIISGNFNFNSHVNRLLSICSQRLYILKKLQNQGLSHKQLNTVCVAIIISNLIYTLPSWAGFLTGQQKDQLNSFLRKCHRYGYTTSITTMDKLIKQADKKLFISIRKPTHCAHYLLPPIKSTTHSLRKRGHKYTLPKCSGSYYKKSYICRYLYSTVSIKTV
jgi:hypothetical protein